MLAFTRPIYDDLSHNNVVSTPMGAHLEIQYGYDFYIASFTLKTGRIGISNTLIQPIS